MGGANATEKCVLQFVKTSVRSNSRRREYNMATSLYSRALKGQILKGPIKAKRLHVQQSPRMVRL